MVVDMLSESQCLRRVVFPALPFVDGRFEHAAAEGGVESGRGARLDAVHILQQFLVGKRYWRFLEV